MEDDDRITDHIYSARRVKQEDVNMQSAGRLVSPTRVKSEHVIPFEDGTHDDEEVKIMQQTRIAEERAFWEAGYNR